MRLCPFSLALLFTALFFGGSGPASGQVPDPNAPPPNESFAAPTASPKGDGQTSFAALFAERGGHRLMVEYPWSRHQDASIEVRLVTGERPTVAGLRPLAFAANHFHGNIRMQIYNVQDAGAGGVVIRTLEVEDAKYEVLGGLTPLGQPATCIARKFVPAEPPKGAHAVYCLLQPWSINRKLLSIELPKKYFAEPGKMKVWFLRGSEILWEQTLDWPGVK